MTVSKQFCCIGLLLALISSPAFAQGILARVERVADGDTITVAGPDGAPARVRLYGIDAPESGQVYGPEATAGLRQLVDGKTVALAIVDRDRYGRDVALVDVAGQSVNAAMIRQGLAWVFVRYCKRPECREWQGLEDKARADRRGLWAGEPVAPWEWRRTALQ